MHITAHQHGLLYEGGGDIEDIRSYLLSLLAAAMICAIVNRLIGDKGVSAVLTKLITGLFLAFMLVRPVVDLDLTGLADITIRYETNALRAVEEGENRTRNALTQFITQQTQAYILDKAQALDADLKVEVTLSDDDIPVPVKVRLSGKASPYAKGRLQAIISEDLGIVKENQVWT